MLEKVKEIDSRFIGSGCREHLQRRLLLKKIWSRSLDLFEDGNGV